MIWVVFFGTPLIWRDVKSLLELLAGTEERVIEMLKAMYPQLEEGGSDSESEGETSSESNDSESEENDELFYSIFTLVIRFCSKLPLIKATTLAN